MARSAQVNDRPRLRFRLGEMLKLFAGSSDHSLRVMMQPQRFTTYTTRKMRQKENSTKETTKVQE
jgi:hypothetical protein